MVDDFILDEDLYTIQIDQKIHALGRPEDQPKGPYRTTYCKETFPRSAWTVHKAGRPIAIEDTCALCRGQFVRTARNLKSSD